MAASWLPKSCEYVAWLDCDIIFKNPNWATDTVRLLKENAVVQLFERCIKSDKGNVVNDACETSISFAKITSPDPVKFLNFERYDVHGHTGFGWAMRREIFDEVGLYEHAISGSADHFMAHAIYGHCGFCIQNALKHDKAQLDHFNEWAARFYPLVKGKLGCVPGDIIHLWHGDLADRRYFKRMHDITDLGFNPYFDIVSEPGKPLSWHPEFNKQGLKDYFYEYFYSRREDGRQDAKR